MSDKRSFYFQTIARDLFERRGAPFYLSSSELSLIEQWEKEGVPLRVVREGIAKSFTLRPSRRGHGRKIFSLTFCAPHVREAFAMYKERTVGRRQKKEKSGEAKLAAGKAVARFTKKIPFQVRWLETLYRKAEEILPTCQDEDLERLEEEVESLIVHMAEPEEKEKARMAVAAEFPDIGPEEARELQQIKLIKLMREKYRIPYLSPFHY